VGPLPVPSSAILTGPARPGPARPSGH